MNLTKTGDGGDDSNKAASTNYGFTVKYKSDHPPKAEEGKEGESQGQKPDTRKDKRNTGNRGKPFEGFKKQFNNEGFDDDGFEVVTDKTKDRRKKNFRKQDSDESGDDGFTITRGDRGERGGRGRGRGGFERGGNGGFERGDKKVADNA